MNIKHLDMENQKEYISEFINEWKSNTEQVDDMSIIGVKI